jgi:hypothetical protein
MNIKELKERYKNYKEKKFLESYGCKTWKEYERRYDKDIGPRQNNAKTFYYGYPYLFVTPDKRDKRGMGIAFLEGGWSVETVDQMIEWCEKNCKGKWRNDWLRGFWSSYNNEFLINEIGGEDYMFFAFKEKSDYIWFNLVWQ